MSASGKKILFPGFIAGMLLILCGCSGERPATENRDASLEAERNIADFSGIRIHGLKSIYEREDENKEIISSKLEAILVELINEERRKAGLEPLSFDFRVKDVARSHSEEMKAMDYFSHNSPVPEKRTLAERLSAASINYWVAGENIAVFPAASNYLEVAEEIMEKYMNSTSHRNNILNPAFTSIGAGVAIDRRIFVTLDFIGEGSL